MFVVASFAAAFLIFLVQPMVGKRILPWFGGVPAVWMLCLAFFQSVLFVGYLYAHLLIRLAPARAQLLVHFLACAAALWALPVLPEDSWKPQGSVDPSSAIAAMLLANVALPFVVLAATGPLVQAWFARRHPERSPYPLYAVSNLGSGLALLGYPFVIEPALALSMTSRVWSIAFTVTAAAVLGCAGLANRVGSGTRVEPESTPGRVPVRHRVLWILLAATAVIVLMGVTGELCHDTASIPFLWVLPLFTYLATFMLCFGVPGSYRRTPLVMIAAAVFLIPEVLTLLGLQPYARTLLTQIGRYFVLLFSACMILHGELYRLRPAASNLTSYYLCTSLGGALGGIFVGAGAPLLFNDYHELTFGIVATGLLYIAACREDPASWLRSGGPRWRAVLAGGLAVSLPVVVMARHAGVAGELVHQERSFFGVLRVGIQEYYGARSALLMNGSTLHGLQVLATPRVPAAYFSRTTGIGVALSDRKEGEGTEVGVVGLGIGTLAAYGREGDRFTFYEIDPAVVRVARNEDYFTYLAESDAEISVVEGDARISLAAENESGRLRFDILVIDAYSSDALPIHLLTREALQVYLDATKPDGLIAFHVTSRHFDLYPLLTALSRDAGFASLRVMTPRRRGVLQSNTAHWFFISRDEERLARLAERAGRALQASGTPRHLYEISGPGADEDAGGPFWTDDYSDLLAVLKR